jgi:GDP-D-mannose 3',5'-epimerase
MENSKTKVLVTGAGGFIGHHLVNYLKTEGYWVRGVDTKYNKYNGKTTADDFMLVSMADMDNALVATNGIDEVYGLAADMGGMGFISFNHSKILYNNTNINFNTLEASKQNSVKRYFFSSSACVYPEYRQTDINVKPLKEEDAYPAQPQDAYGWEKLTMEKLCHHYMEDYGIETRVARFHNMYGIEGTWRGERAKAPSSLCRKVAYAKLHGEPSIEIWGDGEQTRSFCYVSDCVQGVHKLMRSDFRSPLNIGQDVLISINDMAKLIMKIADVKLDIVHVDGPQGVRGRNSDNTLLKQTLDWVPQVSLEEGLTLTYNWVEEQVKLADEQSE